ncbi:MAG: hypothetical protein AB7S44_03535 [Spirochaetales bacterium]
MTGARINKKLEKIQMAQDSLVEKISNCSSFKEDLENANTKLNKEIEEKTAEMRELEALKPVANFKILLEDYTQLKETLRDLQTGVRSPLGIALSGATNAYETKGTPEQITEAEDELKVVEGNMKEALKISQVRRYYVRYYKNNQTQAKINDNNEQIAKLDKTITDLTIEYELKNIDKQGYIEKKGAAVTKDSDENVR